MSNDGVQSAKRHESLYFMDGNVVLLAPRPDQPALLFRVHKSILSTHSPIFSDMFDVCSTPGMTSDSEADRFYDRAPLIHMPDNANHLESVLKILYYQSTLPWTPRSPHNPALITPILELSRKYRIDRIREPIQRHFESDWPQTMSDWDKLESDIELMTNFPDVQLIDDYFPEPGSAIELAHQFEIPSILPAAFYHLSRLSIVDDWDKAHADPSSRIENPTKRTAQWGLLSAKDFRCLLLGKEELPEALHGRENMKDFFFHMVDDGFGCMDECDVGEDVWKDICDRWSSSPDPFALSKSLINSKGQCCHTCTRALMAARAQIWERLGDLFHLKDK